MTKYLVIIALTVLIWIGCSGRQPEGTWTAEEYFKYAKTKFNDGFDYVIMGHLHTPLRREDGKNVYINTGDWIDHFSFGYYDGKDLTLHFWKDSS